MPEPFSLGACAVKAIASAAGLIAVGQRLGAGEGVSFETVASALEAMMTGGEATKVFEERDRRILANTLNGVAKKAEALYEDEILKQTHSPGYDEAVRVAFANVPEVLKSCLPSGAELARLDHDPDKVAKAVLDRALAIDMDIFAKHAEARRILVSLVRGTFAALLGDPKFMATLTGPNAAEVFSRLTRIEGKVDVVHDEIDRLRRDVLARLDAALPTEAHARGVPEPPLRRALRRLGASEVPPAEIPSRFESAVEELVSLRAELAKLRNDRPEFAVIRERALSFINDGDFAAARAELRRGRDAARGLRQEFARAESEFLAAEARVDRLDLEYSDACDKFTEATRLDPDNFGAWIELGDLWRVVGSVSKAADAFRGGRRAAERSANDRDLSVSYDRIGDVLVSQGNLPEALKSYSAGLTIRERLARSDEGNSDWQRDLSVSRNKIGDVLVSQGNLPEALKSYSAGLTIAERLARSDEGNSDWQRDLSVSRNKIGDVLVSQGNLPEALKSYSAGLTIRERLARSDEGNCDWQRDLIVSCVKIAEASPTEARAKLARAGAIANRLRDEGRLAPVDAWMPGDLEARLSALEDGG